MSFNTWSMMATHTQCSSKFLGKVIKSEDEIGPTHAMIKKDILLENIKTFKGQVDQRKLVKVLKFGELRLTKDHYYLISMNKNKLCTVEEIQEEEISRFQ